MKKKGERTLYALPLLLWQSLAIFERVSQGKHRKRPWSGGFTTFEERGKEEVDPGHVEHAMGRVLRVWMEGRGHGDAVGKNRKF